MTAGQQLPQSKHFWLERLAEGVYAAIHREGGAAISNAGIIDLGDRTLVFDALYTPQAAADLRAAAEQISERPIDAVINSHDHYDHIWGNQAFSPDTDIIATGQTRQIIAEESTPFYEWFKEGAAANLEAALADHKAAVDEFQRRDGRVWVDFYQGFMEAEIDLPIRLPNLTFNERLTIHGSRRTAELIPMGDGHSSNDSVLWLPQDGIVFMSDLLFIGCHPYLGSGNSDSLLRILDAVRDMGPTAVVPGHGPVGGAEDLVKMAQYVRSMEALARNLVKEDASAESVAGAAVPAPFEAWIYRRFFPVNMQFLVQSRSASTTGG